MPASNGEKPVSSRVPQASSQAASSRVRLASKQASDLILALYTTQFNIPAPLIIGRRNQTTPPESHEQARARAGAARKQKQSVFTLRLPASY